MTKRGQLQAQLLMLTGALILCAMPGWAARTGSQSGSDYGFNGDIAPCGTIGGVSIDCSTGPFFGGGVFLNDTFLTFIGAADQLVVPLFFAEGVPLTGPNFVFCSDSDPNAADACSTALALGSLTGPSPDGFIVTTDDLIPSTKLSDLRTLSGDFTATGADTGILTLTNLPGQATLAFDTVPVTLGEATTPEPASFLLIGGGFLMVFAFVGLRSRKRSAVAIKAV